MDGKELKELSDLWFFGFFFFHLDKKGDDWMIREDCDIPRLATTPEDWGLGVSEESQRAGQLLARI